MIVSFSVISPTAYNLPMVQGFTSATFPPLNWTRTNPDGSTSWQRHGSAGAYGASVGCMYMNNFNYTTGSGQSDYMSTMYNNFSSQSAPLRLYFDLAYARRNNVNHDSLIISYSTDCGYSWTRIYNKGRLGLVSNDSSFVTSFFVPTASQWKPDSVNLDFLAGQARVTVRFENKSGNGNNLFIDNVNIMHGTLNIGMDELEANLFVNIFPNPSDGNMQIEFDETVNGKVMLSLYNSYGQKMYSEIADMKQHTLSENFGNLPKGVYFLHISEEHHATVQKIVLD
jgi:hypothetical protein